MKEQDGGLWLSREDLIEIGWLFQDHEIVVGNTNYMNNVLHRVAIKRKEFIQPMPNETLAECLMRRSDGAAKEFYKFLVRNCSEEIPNLGDILGIKADAAVVTTPDNDDASMQPVSVAV